MVTAHVRDYTVEGAASISEAVLARRQLAEIPRSLGDDVVVEFEDDAPGGLGVDGDVKLRMLSCETCCAGGDARVHSRRLSTWSPRQTSSW